MQCPWNLGAAAHAYRRLGFGASRETLAHALEVGREATLEALLAPGAHDEVLTRGVRSVLSIEKIEPLAAWWMALILGNRSALVERSALMWHDHFATSNDKVLDPRLMHGQVQVFRDEGLGDFRSLLSKVARDPAMLLWLDGNQNRVGQPNENFAREVLELFALGIGNYDEADVLEAARAFTGWGVERRHFVVRERDHDRGEKRVLGKRGTFDGDDVLQIVSEHPACARWVSRRLLVEFIHPKPTPEEIDEWAAVLKARDWSIGRTIAALAQAGLFWSARARRSRLAGPIEWITLTSLALQARPAPAAAARAAAAMGQALYRPPSVKGWDGGRAWIDPGRWLERHNFVVAAVDAGELDWMRAFGSPTAVDDVPRAVLELLLPDGASPALRNSAQRLAREAQNIDEAFALVTTLVLTAPEAHFV